jgi:hypothetical protein
MQLPVDPVPRPEVYLSAEEVAWSAEQRRSWPNSRPVCILSTRVVTELKNYNYALVDWSAVARAWGDHCTVVQPLMTSRPHYENQIGNPYTELWSTEKPAAGAVVYRNLTSRHYMSLFSVADYYCGGPSGGSHVAAAFGLPSLVVIGQRLALAMGRPACEHGLSVVKFVYPQHRFIVADRIEKNHTDEGYLRAAIEAVIGEVESDKGGGGQWIGHNPAVNILKSRIV